MESLALLERRPGLVLLGVALLFDVSRTSTAAEPDWLVFLSHAAFLSLFAALYQAVLAAQVAASRVSAWGYSSRRAR